jgi:hypothetical protein
MKVSDLPDGVKPLSPEKERAILKDWGPVAPHEPTGEGDLRMVKTTRALDDIVIQALIDGPAGRATRAGASLPSGSVGACAGIITGCLATP